MRVERPWCIVDCSPALDHDPDIQEIYHEPEPELLAKITITDLDLDPEIDAESFARPER